LIEAGTSARIHARTGRDLTTKGKKGKTDSNLSTGQRVIVRQVGLATTPGGTCFTFVGEERGKAGVLVLGFRFEKGSLPFAFDREATRQKAPRKERFDQYGGFRAKTELNLGVRKHNAKRG